MEQTWLGHAGAQEADHSRCHPTGPDSQRWVTDCGFLRLSPLPTQDQSHMPLTHLVRCARSPPPQWVPGGTCTRLAPTSIPALRCGPVDQSQGWTPSSGSMEFPLRVAFISLC